MKIKLLCLVVFISIGTYAQTGIGTITPDASAVLEVNSTDKGFLPPRMTEVQMEAIVDPAEGLVVYCTDCNPKSVYVFDGVDFVNIATGFTSSALTNDCAINGLEGNYTRGAILDATNKFSVTITNTGLTDETIDLSTDDLVLTGVSGITVSSVNPTSVTLNSGQSQLIEYTLVGTPESIGNLTANWTHTSLSCSQTVSVANGDATFYLPQSKFAVSILDGTPVVDIQGVIDNAANQFVIDVPYTSSQGSYDAYTSAVVAGTAGEGGDTNGFSISYPAGTFSATGTIPVTVIVDGDGSYNAAKQLFGAQETIVTLPFMVNGNAEGDIILGVIGGVPDAEFGDGVHDFIYIPVTNTVTGKTWLNNNLGANYANMNHASFDPLQQAANSADADAYGSLYQWGRYTDGHELREATSVLGTSSTSTVTGANADKFLRGSTNWYTGPNPDNLWQGLAGTNNPCPQGYRVPNDAELDAERVSWGSNNAAGAAGGDLKLPAVGHRNRSTGEHYNEGNNGFYWSSSTVSGTSARYLAFGIINASIGNNSRANGFSVRCIKD